MASAVAADAQIAIQVKSGTTWTSNIELSALAPVTFRWRWDGTETPTSVAWQLATVTPTSTATTRATDVIASETGMRLPAKGGVYEEFTVTPASTWPAKFYIRVRVNIGRKTVYSRWASVSVVSAKATLVANPTCALKGWKVNAGNENFWDSTKDFAMFFGSGETVTGPEWDYAYVHILAQNGSRTEEARYRRHITVLKNGVNLKDKLSTGDYVDPAELDATTVRTIAASKTDTVTIGRRWPKHVSGPLTPEFYPPFWADGNGNDAIEFIVDVIPLQSPSTKCSLRFNVR